MTELTPQEGFVLLKEMYQMRDSMYRKQLEADLSETELQLINSRDDVTTRWLQGQAQYIRRKIDEIDSAGTNLSKVGQAKPGMRNAF